MLVGLALAWGACPSRAALAPDPALVEEDEASVAALALLHNAMHVAKSRTWSATQQVTTYLDGAPTISTAHVQHVPGVGSSVRVVPSTDIPVAADVFDPALLGLLDANYDLSVLRVEPCHGRSAHVLQVTRPGRDGRSSVAARFWVDTASGIVLRRDVLDGDGRVRRSSALVELAWGSAAATPVASAQPLRPTGHELDAAGIAELQARGWDVPSWLPGGMSLYDARVMERGGAQVVQLAYSDGLSTLSVFQQPGVVRTTSGGLVRKVGRGTVWQSLDSPVRVVWSSGGRTWTVVSDAAPEVVDEAVRALPHEEPAGAQDGIGPRVWRGMSRVGSWLNPFS